MHLPLVRCLVYIDYFMGSARVNIYARVGVVSEIERVGAANA